MFPKLLLSVAGSATAMMSYVKYQDDLLLLIWAILTILMFHQAGRLCRHVMGDR